MASFIYSIYDYFGAQISVPGYGFPMNDRGSFFNLEPELAGRDRPAQAAVPDHHPGVRHEGRPAAARRSATWAATSRRRPRRTEIVNMVDLGMNVQAAGDAARFHHSQDADRVDLESNLYALVGPQLRGAWASTCGASPANDDVFGGYQAILFQRAPGCAAGMADSGRSAGERRLPGRLGLPKGRRSGRLVTRKTDWWGGGHMAADPPQTPRRSSSPPCTHCRVAAPRRPRRGEAQSARGSKAGRGTAHRSVSGAPAVD